MITITYEKVMAALGLFTAACVAAGWVIRIINGLKKPADDINSKLDSDNKRIKKLEDDMDYITDSISILMRCNLVMLGHMRTNNNSGRMAEMENEIQEFLTER